MLALAWPAAGADHAGAPVVRVEEDWVLVLTEPDEAVDAPQLHTVMSPYGNLETTYAQVTWNYREMPYFKAGGIQLQAWNDDQCRFHKSFGTDAMANYAETVRWTQSLQTDGGSLVFKIVAGESKTWGNFGGDTMQIRGGASVPNLNAYNADVSAAHSGISYGANRVKYLAITEVRRYSAEEMLSVDSTPKVVYRRRTEDTTGR